MHANVTRNNWHGHCESVKSIMGIKGLGEPDRAGAMDIEHVLFKIIRNSRTLYWGNSLRIKRFSKLC